MEKYIVILAIVIILAVAYKKEIGSFFKPIVAFLVKKEVSSMILTVIEKKHIYRTYSEDCFDVLKFSDGKTVKSFSYSHNKWSGTEKGDKVRKVTYSTGATKYTPVFEKEIPDGE